MIIFLLLVLFLLSYILQPVSAANGYLKFDLEREAVRFTRRDLSPNSLSQTLREEHNQTTYWINLSIGTPPQPFSLQLDTGSSNILVPSSIATESTQCETGSFTPDNSSTYRLIQKDTFDSLYADGSEYIGDYITDVLTIGDIVLQTGNVTIGLANKLVKTDCTGVLGIGYQSLFNAPKNATELQNTIVSAMVASGEIGRQAYSIHLNDKDNGIGSIIFGGMDASKYEGDLVALPVLQEPFDTLVGTANYSELSVALTKLSVTDSSGKETVLTATSGPGLFALLDTGSTDQSLTPDIQDRINKGLGTSENGGVPCSYAQSNLTFNYQFGGDDGPTISIPLSAMMDTQPQDEWTFDDGTQSCSLNFNTPRTDGKITLGDSFMRSGYFVYDLENNLVAIAQAATSAKDGDQNVTPIPSGTDIPGCTSTNTYTITQSTVSLASGAAATAATTRNVPFSPTFNIGVTTDSTAASATSSGALTSSSNSAGSLNLEFASYAAGVPVMLACGLALVGAF